MRWPYLEAMTLRTHTIIILGFCFISVVMKQLNSTHAMHLLFIEIETSSELLPLVVWFLCLFRFIFLDINECAASSSPCSSNALCTNNVGSYSCSCNAGFAGNGITCNGM